MVEQILSDEKRPMKIDEEAISKATLHCIWLCYGRNKKADKKLMCVCGFRANRNLNLESENFNAGA